MNFRSPVNLSAFIRVSKRFVHNTNLHEAVQTAFHDLSKILSHNNGKDCDNGDAMISKSPSILEHASQDASSYPIQRPDICIIPKSRDQICECVKYCYGNDIPIVPVGARTGLEGGIHALHGGVSFDMSQMKEIIQVNLEDMDCHVEAGLTWRDLNDHLRSYGLWFPVDPGASATLGGMSSTSASGTNAVKYGTMRENVLGLEAIIRNGLIINTAGSEGTLGIFNSIRLKLHPLPTSLAVATVAFPDVKSAVDSVVEVIQCAIPVARIEFLDAPGVDACYRDSKLDNLDPSKPMLFVEIHGLNETNLKDQMTLMKEIFDQHQSTKFQWSSKQEERTRLWKARHNLHWSILKTKPGFLNIDTDVCVPISKFPDMVARTHELIDRFGLDAPLMGHAGDGNFHSVILYDPTKPDDFSKAKSLANEMGRAAIELEGTVTGEHGVGRGKIDLIEEQFDEQTLDVMYQIKALLDPKNLFNPGKIFRAERVHQMVKLS